MAHIDGAQLRAFAQTISGDRAGHLRHDFAHCGIVRAQDGRAVKRHAVQELHKRSFEPAEVMAVGFHVVGVDVGDHRHHRQQIEK